MTKRKRGCLWIVGMIFVAVLIGNVVDRFIPSAAVRALPKGAKDVQEFYKVVGITADFSRLLRARIPESQVADYARKVGAENMEQGGAGRDYFSWTGGPEWFRPKNPPKYFHYEKQYRILVGWEDGCVYFDATKW